MSELTWASEVMRENIAPNGSVKERIRTAARALGWEHSRTRTLWYADDRASIKPKEMRRLEEVSGVKFGRQELEDFDRLIARADAYAAASSDPDFHGAFAAAFRAFVGALHRPRAGGGE